MLSVSVLSSSNFNPRSPRGERRNFPVDFSKVGVISIHALREESDRSHLDTAFYPLSISIHALREESDKSAIKSHFFRTISIHALREESDIERFCKGFSMLNFNPRSPRGERLASFFPAQGDRTDFNPRSPRGERLYSWLDNMRQYPISIHALREESDRQQVIFFSHIFKFQSTLSARRATRCLYLARSCTR